MGGITKEGKKVVLISFFDRTCETTRMLSAALKQAGHKPYLVFLKDDRAVTLKEFKPNNKNYQMIIQSSLSGSGEDVNPPSNQEIDFISDIIKSIDPMIIGFTVRTATKELCKKLTKHLRQTFPAVRYIAGGYGVTLEPEFFLEFVDYVCLGEGERAVVDLVELADPTNAPNVGSLRNGKFVYSPLAKGCNVDKLPTPDWSDKDKYMIEDNRISPIHEYFDVATYCIFTARGCPSSCTYCQACQWPNMYQEYNATIPKYRLRSPDNVLTELLEAKDKYNIQHIRFLDSIFGVSKKWFYEFMDLYDKHICLKFFAYVDVRWTDKEMIKRMAQSGLMKTTVGIQASTEQIRKEIMGRDVTDEQIIEFAEAIEENKIPYKYDVVHWNPFDTNETLKEGTEFFRKLPKGEEINLFQLKVFPGSKLHTKIKAEKPTPLSDQEYEYWAWIYQLMVRDKTTEKIADAAVKNQFYRDNPQRLRDLLEKANAKLPLKYRLYAAKNISKNETITSAKLVRCKTTLLQAIPRDRINSVISKKARNDICEGDPITINNIYGSYEHKFD